MSILEKENGEKCRKIELTQDDVLALKESFLFSGEQSISIETATKHPQSRLVIYPVGAKIPQQGGNELGFVLQGKIEVGQIEGDDSLLMRHLQLGDLFGVANLFSQKRDRFSNLLVKKEARVFYISASFLKEEMAKNTQLIEDYICFLESRIGYLNQRIKRLSKARHEDALMLLLKEEAKGQQSFTLDASVSSLSRKLNISRASLYRAFDVLEEQGFIIKNGKQIIIEEREN